MEEICSFEINGKIYTIYNVDRIKGKDTFVGQTTYDDTDIFIEKGNFKDMLLTLKHELMHVWLYENGHINQTRECTFDYEQVCELVAVSNNSINKVVNLYLESL